ncbi:TIGR04141 family sporadically distributed protein [Streptomyces cyaneofuscatus]|uniref:TIGR04141 family sporadically distributed protein n=1 Tax=Streptomyces cyaneofuscatus TaxID=66883 RepID=UPI00381A4946
MQRGAAAVRSRSFGRPAGLASRNAGAALQQEDGPDRRLGRLVLLDCKTIPNPAKPSDQIEICDFLTRDDTIVLVKQARGSGALSHLYNQARVAVEVLHDSAWPGRNSPSAFAPRATVPSVSRG